MYVASNPYRWANNCCSECLTSLITHHPSATVSPGGLSWSKRRIGGNGSGRLHIAANTAAAAAYETDRRLQYQKLKLAGFDAAPIHIAVFCDETTKQGHGLGSRTMPEMLRYSCVSMISTLWLAARAEGLGVGWVSILDPKEVATCLGVTPSWVLVGYLLLGWPEDEHLDPELERFGWQSRSDSRTRISRV